MNNRMEDATGRVIFTAIVAWGAVVAGAALGDTFGKFDARSVAIFAAGVALYGFAVYRLDAQLRTYIQLYSRGTLAAAAGACLAMLGVASLEHVPALAVFAAPLAAMAGAATVEKLATRPTRARAKSPAVSRVAT